MAVIVVVSVAISVGVRQDRYGGRWSARVVCVAAVWPGCTCRLRERQAGILHGPKQSREFGQGLTSFNPSGGISGLKSQVQKIQSDATALVNSAKGDFPSETSAI